jgi:two-component sensor histidine kinase
VSAPGQSPSTYPVAAPRRPFGMPRSFAWPQLLLGWIPIGVLLTTLMLTAHVNPDLRSTIMVALRLVITGAILGVLVQRFSRRLEWPHPPTPRFVAIHLIAAIVFSAAWVLSNSLIVSLRYGEFMLEAGYGVGPFLILGVWLYIMIAGVVYASLATERAARAEALAARSQLAALRAQLNPHFLFNALHTVVQLIPVEPRRASQAAEQVAGLLRTTLEEDRDLVPLADELNFVQRYLDVESIRFGERLVVKLDLTEDARDAMIPAFALQTLVENAVRHGAAPNVDPTTITVTGRSTDDQLTVSVHNTGGRTTAPDLEQVSGTGLRRLRERLAALFGTKARLDLVAADGGGFTASLAVPLAGR